MRNSSLKGLLILSILLTFTILIPIRVGAIQDKENGIERISGDESVLKNIKLAYIVDDGPHYNSIKNIKVKILGDNKNYRFVEDKAETSIIESNISLEEDTKNKKNSKKYSIDHSKDSLNYYSEHKVTNGERYIEVYRSEYLIVDREKTIFTIPSNLDLYKKLTEFSKNPNIINVTKVDDKVYLLLESSNDSLIHEYNDEINSIKMEISEIGSKNKTLLKEKEEAIDRIRKKIPNYKRNLVLIEYDNNTKKYKEIYSKKILSNNSSIYLQNSINNVVAVDKKLFMFSKSDNKHRIDVFDIQSGEIKERVINEDDKDYKYLINKEDEYKVIDNYIYDNKNNRLKILIYSENMPLHYLEYKYTDGDLKLIKKKNLEIFLTTYELVLDDKNNIKFKNYDSFGEDESEFYAKNPVNELRLSSYLSQIKSDFRGRYIITIADADVSLLSYVNDNIEEGYGSDFSTIYFINRKIYIYDIKKEKRVFVGRFRGESAYKPKLFLVD